MAQIIGPHVRLGVEFVYAEALEDQGLRDAWKTLADLCDQAVSGAASLGEVSANLHCDGGETLTFARTVLSQPTWRDLACLFARLCEGILDGVAIDTCVQFARIHVSDDVTLTIEGHAGPADQESYGLMDMLNAYCQAQMQAQEGLQALAVEGRFAYATNGGVRVSNGRHEWHALIPWKSWEALRELGLVEVIPGSESLASLWRINDAGRKALAAKESPVEEKITEDVYGSWRCLCGNIAESDGFYPCNQAGEQVEPEPGLWDGALYVCARCGRIINQDTLAVVSKE